MVRRLWMVLAVFMLPVPGFSAAAGDADPTMIVTAAIDRMRGVSSHAVLTMRIVRPSWQRETTLEAWTRGREDALIRFTSPARDRGNATLKLGERMWTFTPKLNRTVRLPASLMSQSWAGSDFSYDDLSRTDNLLQHYTLTMAERSADGPHQVFHIQADPHPDAPVVWGREVILIRDDDVVLRHTFFDQDLQAVKVMEALEIGTLSGRTFAVRSRMHKTETPEAFTEIAWREAAFDLELSPELFTLFSLQHGAPGDGADRDDDRNDQTEGRRGD